MEITTLRSFLKALKKSKEIMGDIAEENGQDGDMDMADSLMQSSKEVQKIIDKYSDGEKYDQNSSYSSFLSHIHFNYPDEILVINEAIEFFIVAASRQKEECDKLITQIKKWRTERW